MPGQVKPVIGSKDRSVGWYDPPITTVEPSIRDLLENYSRVPADEIVTRIIETVSSHRLLSFRSPIPNHHHLSLSPNRNLHNTPQQNRVQIIPLTSVAQSQRDKIWDVFPWPCVGQFRFLDLSLSRKPSYARILSRLNAGDRLLDVGCCLAQDLRKLTRDGAPSSSLYGLEMEPEFIRLGYEFFGDEESFQAKFVVADLMDRGNEEVKSLEGSFGVVQLGMVLHIWDFEAQTRACERVVEMLRGEQGVMVVGQSVGDVDGKEAPGRGGKMIFKHNVQSFEKMWEEVGRRTGTKWVVRARLDEGLGIDQKKRLWDAPTTRRLSFEVERV